MLPAALNGDAGTFVRVRDTEGLPAFTVLSTALDDLMRIEAGAAAAANRDSQSSFTSARTSVIVFLVLGLVLGVAFGLYVARLIITTVARVSHVIAGLARASITTVRDNAQSLAAASEELTAVNQQIASSATRTSDQAATVSSAAEQVSASVQTQETARATEDITARIQTIQSDTLAATAGIDEIASVIEQVSSYSTVIASAVEEQTATSALGQARQASEDLARMSAELTRVVSQFNA